MGDADVDDDAPANITVSPPSPLTSITGVRMTGIELLSFSEDCSKGKVSLEAMLVGHS